ncbi:hypothetical protein G6F50_017885 [Rhizopus delemar]|uniref:Uncharacterized protein n=1 Tax=Rhizopus delemar TaxID=936053 RepID=A0A9P7C061_9FUNG|nr:hypothetical protein G6F50_017885 [Rhizopus delemar]
MYGIAQTVLKDKPGAPEMPAQPTDEQQQKAIEAALELAYADKPARDKVVDDAKAALEQSTAVAWPWPTAIRRARWTRT